jgi:hypothetical protein
VLAIPIRDPGHIELIPTGAGRRRVLKHEGFARYDWAGFLGDSQRILFIGSKAGSSAWEAYTLDLAAGSTPRRVGSFGSKRAVISPDGRTLVKRCPSGQCLLDLETLEERPVPGLSGASTLFWGQGGKQLFVRPPRPMPALVQRLDLASGEKTPWRELEPPDPVGINAVVDVVGTPDGRAYAYTYYRRLSELFVVDGLR